MGIHTVRNCLDNLLLTIFISDEWKFWKLEPIFSDPRGFDLSGFHCTYVHTYTSLWNYVRTYVHRHGIQILPLPPPPHTHNGHRVLLFAVSENSHSFLFESFGALLPSDTLELGVSPCDLGALVKSWEISVKGSAAYFTRLSLATFSILWPSSFILRAAL